MTRCLDNNKVPRYQCPVARLQVRWKWDQHPPPVTPLGHQRRRLNSNNDGTDTHISLPFSSISPDWNRDKQHSPLRFWSRRQQMPEHEAGASLIPSPSNSFSIWAIVSPSLLVMVLDCKCKHSEQPFTYIWYISRRIVTIHDSILLASEDTAHKIAP